MVLDAPPEILIQHLQEMIKLWQKYMKLFDNALESETPPEELRNEFRDLHVEITRKAQYLTLAAPDNIFDLWKDMKKVLSETPRLTILRKEVPIRITNFRTIWHDVSIALNQKQGQLRQLLDEHEHQKAKKKKK